MTAVLWLQPTREPDTISTCEPLRAFPRFVTERGDLDVYDAWLRRSAAHATLYGQAHTAFVAAGTVDAQLGIGRQPSDEAYAVHTNNTVGL